jgi:salicylate hydroxylase
MASMHSVANALQEFAQARWRRNARVQERSTKNGQIFHATGWTQQSRDFGLRLLGGQLMDMPWLYAAQ